MWDYFIWGFLVHLPVLFCLLTCDFVDYTWAYCIHCEFLYHHSVMSVWIIYKRSSFIVKFFLSSFTVMSVLIIYMRSSFILSLFIIIQWCVCWLYVGLLHSFWSFFSMLHNVCVPNTTWSQQPNPHTDRPHWCKTDTSQWKTSFMAPREPVLTLAWS